MDCCCGLVLFFPRVPWSFHNRNLLILWVTGHFRPWLLTCLYDVCSISMDNFAMGCSLHRFLQCMQIQCKVIHCAKTHSLLKIEYHIPLRWKSPQPYRANVYQWKTPWWRPKHSHQSVDKALLIPAHQLTHNNETI